MWGKYNGDFCSFPSTSHVSVTCHDGLVKELKFRGNKVVKAHTNFNGFAVPKSLGIWGNLPNKIHRLVLLEFLDLSSNYFFCSVSAQMYKMINLKSLNLVGNYFNKTMPHWLEC
ncbi:hypothetical protein ACFE04_019015 [Oxalis oulophora]